MEQQSGGICNTSVTSATTVASVCSSQPSDDGVLVNLGGGLCGNSASQLLGSQTGDNNKTTTSLLHRSQASSATTTASTTIKTITTSSAAPSPVTSPQGKIFGRNNNGNSKYNNLLGE
jgi:hypothetical protein